MMFLLLASTVFAQSYRFPTSAEDYSAFYPTAYFDHDGVDWACADLRYSGHRGSDFGGGSWDGMEAGRDIVAGASGTVIAVNDGEFDACTTGDCEGGGGYGNYVKLQHSDGRTTYYAHLKKWSVLVEVGQSITCGDKLGEMGSSGYSTGPHVHFEMRNPDGASADPFSGDCGSTVSSWVDQGTHGALPGLICEDIPACEPVLELSCRDTILASNDGGGATTAHHNYGCGSFTWAGPEIAWWFATDRTETVTVSVTGLDADLDLFVLDSDACDGSDCLAHSENGETNDESLTFDATADHIYVIVVDGWEGATSDFQLDAACEGSWPGSTTGGTRDTADTATPPPDDGGDPDTDGDTAGDTDTDEDPTRDRTPRTDSGDPAAGGDKGCGCAASAQPTGAWPWIALLAMGVRLRKSAAGPAGRSRPYRSPTR
jgi:hypothetical protein